ncbi:MAG: c-type cytochrome [Alphaproteobacteria bacterium]
MLRRAVALAIVALAALATGMALAQGNIEAGRQAAERWCVECHVISTKDTKALVGAPSFFTLAQDPSRTVDSLRASITNPHPPMPNPELPARTIDDLVAYIRSLR